MWFVPVHVLSPGIRGGLILERILRYMGLGSRVDLGGSASSGWRGLGYILEADLILACMLVGRECTQAEESHQRWE